MRAALLGLLLLAGCEQPTPKAACFALETCELQFYSGPEVSGLCVYGKLPDGSKTGEVHRFLTRDMLEAWSQLQPGARACE